MSYNILVNTITKGVLFMKKCLFCGKTIEKKDYESSRDFERRLYCDKECFNNYRLKKRKQNLIGKRFGKIIVEDVVYQNLDCLVLVRCDCGNNKMYKYSGFKVSPPKHCGCNNANIKHGMSKTQLYKSWISMKRRCDYPDEFHTKYYKDKGIKYCDEWKNFDNFMIWALSNGYINGYTIERIDNSKGYYPDNCKWIPKNEQPKNRTNNHFIEIEGQTKTISEWCEEYNIKWTTFYARLKKGKTGKQLIERV